MELVVPIPQNVLDAMHSTPEEFVREARMAMAAKLYELKRLPSGMAAELAGVSRVEFLRELHRFGVAVVDLTSDDVLADIGKA
jgi:predicted HTH domain antitoxin